MIGHIMVISVSALRIRVGSPSEKLNAQIGDLMNSADCNKIGIWLLLANFQIDEWLVKEVRHQISRLL